MKLIIFKVIFIIIVYYNLDISQIDVKIVFLYKLINQLIYIKPLKDIEIKTNINLVCKLLKVLYDPI